MSERVLAVAEELCREIESFDPALYSGADRALLAEALARTEKACGGARARAAARGGGRRGAQGPGLCRRGRLAGPEHGQLPGRSRAELGTARSLEDLPATAEALAKGQVPPKEAAEVARGEAGRPGSEKELVGLAQDQGVPLPTQANG